MVFFLGLVIIAGLLFLLAAFVFGRGEEMAAMPPDATPVELPEDRPVDGADVRALRLSIAVRGYRMREVDWVLEQLAVALDQRDRALEKLDRLTELAEVAESAELAESAESAELAGRPAAAHEHGRAGGGLDA